MLAGTVVTVVSLPIYAFAYHHHGATGLALASGAGIPDAHGVGGAALAAAPARDPRAARARWRPGLARALVLAALAAVAAWGAARGAGRLGLGGHLGWLAQCVAGGAAYGLVILVLARRSRAEPGVLVRRMLVASAAGRAPRPDRGSDVVTGRRGRRAPRRKYRGAGAAGAASTLQSRGGCTQSCSASSRWPPPPPLPSPPPAPRTASSPTRPASTAVGRAWTSAAAWAGSRSGARPASSTSDRHPADRAVRQRRGRARHRFELASWEAVGDGDQLEAPRDLGDRAAARLITLRREVDAKGWGAYVAGDLVTRWFATPG